MSKNMLFILANIDDTFLSADLGPQFKITREATADFLPEVCKLSNLAINNTIVHFMPFLWYYDGYDETYCTIEGLRCVPSIFIAKYMADDSQDLTFNPHEHINNAFKISRLLKECNPQTSISFKFTGEVDFLSPALPQIPHKPVFRTKPLSLSSEELDLLNNYMKLQILPFSDPKLNLAHQNYEQSIQLTSFEMNYLSGMIALETLMTSSDSGNSISYQISRNTAVLLSKDKESGTKIMAMIKKLYDIRSRIVHEGFSSKLQPEHIIELRQYLREAILKTYSINLPVSELLGELTKSGFGDYNR